MKPLPKLLICLTGLFCFGLSSPGQETNLKVSVKSVRSISHIALQAQESISKLLISINKAYSQNAEEIIPPSGCIEKQAWADLQRLWENSRMYYIHDKDYKYQLIEKPLSNFSGTNIQEYEVRPFQVMMMPSQTREELVFTINNEGMIADIKISLGQHQFAGLLDSEGEIDYSRRFLIGEFLETFRTAYNKKDLPYLEKVYSDDALIIVGKVLEKSNSGSSDGFYATLDNKEVQYIKLSKKDYLDRLAGVFNQSAQINVDFSDIHIAKHLKNPDFYGISLKQYWKSGYSDEGFLFLMIQFRPNDNPLIWVRTWQDVSDTKEDDLFGFHNFIID